MNNWSSILILLLLSFSVLAFDSERHIPPTNDAVDLYNDCVGYFPDKFDVDLSEKDKEAIAKANKGMDKLSFSRGWNWHFYDQKFNYETMSPGHLEPGFLGMNRSLHKDFVKKSKKLLEQIEKDKNDKEQLLKYAGKLIHYIQDMAVPAHVAPIYHVAWSKDKFDGYTASETHKVSVSKDECRTYIKNKSKPVTILTTLANETLSSIKEKANKELYWTDFWNVYPDEPGKKKGFSSYGKCDNVFGDSKNTKCRVETSTFDKYFQSRYEGAVKASLELLIFVGISNKAN